VTTSKGRVGEEGANEETEAVLRVYPIELKRHLLDNGGMEGCITTHPAQPHENWGRHVRLIKGSAWARGSFYASERSAFKLDNEMVKGVPGKEAKPTEPDLGEVANSLR